MERQFLFARILQPDASCSWWARPGLLRSVHEVCQLQDLHPRRNARIILGRGVREGVTCVRPATCARDSVRSGRAAAQRQV